MASIDNSFLFSRGGSTTPDHEEGRDLTFVKGYLLLGFTLLSFVIGVYMVLVAKFMPDTGNNILDFIKQDMYYTLLIPSTIPIYFLFAYINWVSMKFFRHN